MLKHTHIDSNQAGLSLSETSDGPAQQAPRKAKLPFSIMSPGKRVGAPRETFETIEELCQETH